MTHPMGWKYCVLDATMGAIGGAFFTFCPLVGDPDGDFEIVTGMNWIQPLPPPGLEFVGVVHEGGQAAVDEFCETHKAALALVWAARAAPPEPPR